MIKKLLLSTALLYTANAMEVTKEWESKANLKVPESVILDTQKGQLYVANINGMPLDKDGNGFISIMNLDGTIKTLNFAQGMNAPKGMAIYNNKLFVSDIDTLRVVDLDSGKIIENYFVKEAKFLNDVAVTKDGIVYVSDFSPDNKAIYKLEDGKFLRWMGKGNLLGERPNGLWIKDDLLVVGTKEGSIYHVALKNKKISTFQKDIGVNGIDGILPFKKDSYISSDWAGRVFISNGKTSTKIIDGSGDKVNAADIWYDQKSSMLYIPTFFDNRILGYKVK